jgi:glyoxylase-like metal-dependent hydrolase (beta-lactamase superfamily II)/rhodanese-related sulfurtransferase
MLFFELNRGKCKTYLLGCEETRHAVLLDPVRDHIERYLAIAAYHRLTIDLLIDTHTHADHRSGSMDLRELTGARVAMHRRAPAPCVDAHLEDGQTVAVGNVLLRCLYTPGHTPDSISLHAGDRVFTGDTLLIGGTGRADFAGGDPGAQYDSIVHKLFALPDDTLVYPAHDYRGNTHTTIGEEKRRNPRIAGRTREEYIDLMNHLGLPLPTQIQEVLQPNQSAIDDDRIRFPTLAELNRVQQRSAVQLRELLSSREPPLLLDVRELAEFHGELGHIPGSLLVPLKELSTRACELDSHKGAAVIAICRAGVRSATAAAILTGLGFERVYSLEGGMLDWTERGFPIER